MGPMRPLSVDSFPSAFSSTLGKERKRRVCPVGAVSNTITEYSMDLTCLSGFIYAGQRVQSKGCAEGSRDVLHDLGKGHGLVYARNGKRKVLHHGAHHAIIVRCLNGEEKIVWYV
jgi:hypothetical protein